MREGLWIVPSYGQLCAVLRVDHSSWTGDFGIFLKEPVHTLHRPGE